VPDFLDEKRSEIDDRLAELQPLVEEYNRLQAAAAALAQVAGSSAARAVASAAAPALEETGSADAGVSTSPPSAPSAPSASSVPASVPRLAPVRRGPGRPRSSGSVSSENGNGGGEDAGISMDAAAAAAAAPPGVPAPIELRPSTGPRRAGRPKGSGQRAAEALRIVREQPGVTIPELADRMGIKQNYLYRVLPELVQEGKVVKQGRGWHPRAA
jgi:hypothetical protein